MLHVAVGQCGGQLQEQFWRLAATEFGTGTLEPSLPAVASAGPRPEASLPANPLYDAWGFANAVLVDSEPKVVQPLVDTSSRLCIPSLDRHACLYEQSGRGNNWAWGYHMGRLHGSPAVPLWERAVDTVRRKLEAADAGRDLSVWHSVGGGTGSGLGSRLLVELRDRHPKTNLLSIAVTPHRRGETPLQHYNSMLCLYNVQQHADACVLVDNDSVLEQVAALQSKPASGGPPRVSTWDMNAAISQTLAGLLFPTAGPRGTFRAFNTAHFVGDLAPAAHLRFVECHSPTVNLKATSRPRPPKPASAGVPSTRGRRVSSGAGRGVSRGLRRAGSASSKPSRRGAGARKASTPMQPLEPWCHLAARVAPTVGRRRVDGNRPIVFAAKLYARGAERADVVEHRASMREPPREAPAEHHSGRRGPPPPWPGLPLSEDWGEVNAMLRKAHPMPGCALSSSITGGQGLRSTGARRSLVTCVNSSHTADVLRHCLERSQRMFNAKAYLHWYYRYGCEPADFERAFEALSDVYESYDTGVVARW